MTHMLGSIREFAERKAIISRQEAMAWDILARDMMREKQHLEEQKKKQATCPKTLPPEESPTLEDRLYVRVKDACKIKGMGRTALYNEIKEGRLPIKKAGHKTLIAVADIYA